MILVLLKLPEHSSKFSETNIVRLVMDRRIFIFSLSSAFQILLLDLVQYLPHNIDIGVHIALSDYQHICFCDEASVLAVEQLEYDSEDFEVLLLRCGVLSC